MLSQVLINLNLQIYKKLNKRKNYYQKYTDKKYFDRSFAYNN